MYIENNDFGVHMIVNGPLQNNSYIIVKGKDCIVIDPSSKVIREEISRLDLNLVAILLTHGHFDHIKGVEYIVNENTPIYIHKDDNNKCNGVDSGWAEMLKRFRITPFNATNFVSCGEVLHIIGLDIKVLSTPGHSKGSVCYIVGDYIFSGDTLFEGSFGRYDFEDGSIVELKNSILNKLFKLEKNYRVFPGHGSDTTLDREKMENSILWM